MAKDTEKTNEETVTIDKISFATRARTFWDTNKNKLFWFGVGAVTGAGTVIGTAMLLEPSEEQYEGDDEETIVIDTTSEAIPS